jgi:hypothetical protein
VKPQDDGVVKLGYIDHGLRAKCRGEAVGPGKIRLALPYVCVGMREQFKPDADGLGLVTGEGGVQ